MKTLAKRLARWLFFALDGEGHGRSSRLFRVLSWCWRRGRWLYHLLFKRQPDVLLVLDGPAELSGFACLSGWVISRRSRIVTVEAWWAGRLIAETVPRRHRPDVAEKLPSFHVVQPCGFRLAPPPGLLPDGQHPLRLLARDQTGASASLDVTVRVDRYGLADDDSQTPPHLTGSNREYQHWLASQPPVPPAVAAHRGSDLRLSLLMPLFRPRPMELRQAIDSLRAQAHLNWELCLCDDGSQQPELERFLKELIVAEPRIRVARHEQNRGIARATNTAWELASGDWLAFMDQDDVLASTALARVAERLAAGDVDLLYTDEDRLDAHGCRTEPFFKPDWSPDLLRSMMYLAHLCVYRRQFLEQVGRCDPRFDGGQDWDLALRATERTQRIVHVPEVLYHWRQGGNSAGSAFNCLCHERGRLAILESLRRGGERGRVEDGPSPCTFHVRYDLPDRPPLVSILIPTKDQPRRLEACLQALRRRTRYRPIEIIVIDNGSTTLEARWHLVRCGADQLLRLPGPFNHSRLNNVAARAARGEFLLLLNDDVEALQADWLTAMVEQGCRPGVGAVGARLHYPDGQTQHAGIATGVGPGAVNLNSSLLHDGIDRGTARLIRNVSAVTGACLLVRRDWYLRLSGMDEINLPTSYNDVDLCLRLRREGLRIVYTPLAQLLHHESASRRIDPEEDRRYGLVLHRRWGSDLHPDPYWSPRWNADLAGRPGFTFADWSNCSPAPLAEPKAA